MGGHDLIYFRPRSLSSPSLRKVLGAPSSPVALGLRREHLSALLSTNSFRYFRSLSKFHLLWGALFDSRAGLRPLLMLSLSRPLHLMPLSQPRVEPCRSPWSPPDFELLEGSGCMFYL